MDRTEDISQENPGRELRKGFEYDESGNVVTSRFHRVVNTDPRYCDRFRIPGLVCTAVCVAAVIYFLFVHQYHIHMNIDVGIQPIDDHMTAYDLITRGYPPWEASEGTVALFWAAIALTAAGILFELLLIFPGFLGCLLLNQMESLGAVNSVSPLEIVVDTFPSSMVLGMTFLVGLLAFLFASRFGCKYVYADFGW